MPEGHSVHRIARQFRSSFLGEAVSVTSPQGRFAADARLIDGHRMVLSRAVGKQLFLEFDNGLWLRVHLGMYGAWDFAGRILTGAGAAANADPAKTDDAEPSLASIGAPRRLRMAESERIGERLESFPPEPVGQVRVRLLTDHAVADLRGPTACEVLDAASVEAQLARLGPDPLVDDPVQAEQRFVDALAKKQQPIGLVLMDQSVVSGIGNVFRAELLFRARIDPDRAAATIPEEQVRALWRDWAYLLGVGVETGQMLTMDGLDEDALAHARASREHRHWVYHRTGEPCRVCGTPIAMRMAAGRKLYWCPECQK